MSSGSNAPAEVVRLSELPALGISRGRRRAQVRADRWHAIPHRGVVLHNGPLSGEAALRAALMQVGGGARLGGVTSLEVDGLKGFDEPRIHIWVPKSRRKLEPRKDIPGCVVLHETRRWTLDDTIEVGLPPSTRAVATLQAALWARSPRQAALCLVMPIQQRLVRADDVALELARVKRHEFRRALTSVLADIMGGVQSLNELDFAAECRRRGLPEPTRQEVRRLPNGRVYLDVRWAQYGVCVEVNGAGHDA